MTSRLSDVENKVNEYMAEFSDEKAVDIAETMLEMARDINQEVPFWLSVLSLLKYKITIKSKT